MANILVVDDELGIRDLLFEILNDEGHAVEVAENAAQARLARQAARPDLVLLDIWMPDTDGVTLLKEWAGAGLLNMPVIMMSGHATIDTAVEATRIGAQAFLEKPITLQRLLKTISTGLARGRLPVVKSASGAFVPVVPPAAAPVAAMQEPAEAVAPAAAVVAAPLDPSLLGDISLELPLREARDAFERVYFEYHLARENHSMTRVSDKTGLERTHLYRKLKQLGIESRKRGG
jgi:DNA-binding NtrC family response regulator